MTTKSLYGNTNVKDENLRYNSKVIIPKLDIKIIGDTLFPKESEYGTDLVYAPYFMKDPSIDNYMFHDKVLVKWDQTDQAFMSLNPEIWLFRYTKTTSKMPDVNYRSKEVSWKHPVHLDGSKYPNSAFYSGTNYAGNNNLLLRNTEFDLTPRGEYQEIGINPNDWFTGKNGLRYDPTTPYELNETNEYKIFGASGTIRKKFVCFKFAIVIDSDQFNGSETNPIKKKIVGPMSEELIVFMPQNDTAFFYNNIAYFCYGTKSYKKKFNPSLFIPEPYDPSVFTFFTNNSEIQMTFVNYVENYNLTITYTDSNDEDLGQETIIGVFDTINVSLVGGGPFKIEIKLNENTIINDLNLSNNGIVEFNNADKLNGLTSLNLSNNSIQEFDPTKPLPSTLENLVLSANNLIDFNPSLSLPNSIGNLVLSANNLIDFNPSLSLPTQLQRLYLNSNSLETFDPELPLPNNLQTLNLSYNQLTEFNPTLALPTNLQFLDMTSNIISTFDPSVQLPNLLQALYLDNNLLTKFDPSLALPNNLQTLILNNNQLTEFDPTLALPNNLRHLNLNNNLLTVFDPTLGLPNILWSLALNGNNLNEFNPSFAIPNLQILFLNDNNLVSFSTNFTLSPVIKRILLLNNSLSTNELENILQYVDGSTINSGYKELLMLNNAPLNAQSLIYKASLQSKGWSVTNDI